MHRRRRAAKVSNIIAPPRPQYLGRIRIMGTTVPSEVTLAPLVPFPNFASVQVSGGGVHPSPP